MECENLKKHNHESKHINSDYLGRCDSTENNLSQFGSRVTGK